MAILLDGNTNCICNLATEFWYIYFSFILFYFQAYQLHQRLPVLFRASSCLCIRIYSFKGRKSLGRTCRLWWTGQVVCPVECLCVSHTVFYMQRVLVVRVVHDVEVTHLILVLGSANKNNALNGFFFPFPHFVLLIHISVDYTKMYL